MWHGKGQFAPDPSEDLTSKEDLETVARRELGETPEVRQKSLERLRELLQEDEGFRVPPDDVLVMFLRAKKYRVQDAVKATKKYFRARRDIPQYFDNLTPSTIPYENVFHDNNLIMFSRDARGRAVGYIQLGKWNTDICSMDDLMRCAIVATESNLRNEEMQVRGIVAIADLKGFGVHHMMQLTPRCARRIITLGQDTVPIRLKAFYYINTPAVFRVIHALVRPFLSAKLLSRLHFLAGDISELREVVPLELIPKEFGGTQEDFDFDAQESFFHSETDYFERMLECGYSKQ